MSTITHNKNKKRLMIIALIFVASLLSYSSYRILYGDKVAPTDSSAGYIKSTDSRTRFLKTPISKLEQLKTESSTNTNTIERQSTDPMRVLVVVFEPKHPITNKPLWQMYNWNDYTILNKQIISALDTSTDGTVKYKIVKTEIYDEIPRKKDGFLYTYKTYSNCMTDPANCHQPDTMDYEYYVKKLNLCERKKNGEFDEVWLWGGPYFGFRESIMVTDSYENWFFINGEPVYNEDCTDRFVIMGFNYERGLAEALHDFGHRIEFTLEHYFGETRDNGIFIKECGNTHFPPNATKDYDYDNQTIFTSKCSDNVWKYPYSGYDATVTGNCMLWGCTQEGYFRWWLARIPNTDKENWWNYILKLP